MIHKVNQELFNGFKKLSSQIDFPDPRFTFKDSFCLNPTQYKNLEKIFDEFVYKYPNCFPTPHTHDATPLGRMYHRVYHERNHDSTLSDPPNRVISFALRYSDGDSTRFSDGDSIMYHRYLEGPYGNDTYAETLECVFKAKSAHPELKCTWDVKDHDIPVKHVTLDLNNEPSIPKISSANVRHESFVEPIQASVGALGTLFFGFQACREIHKLYQKKPEKKEGNLERVKKTQASVWKALGYTALTFGSLALAVTNPFQRRT
jgi:hypothetical protein